MKIAQIEANVIDHMGSDLSVVNAARVSFDKESKWEISDNGYRTLSSQDAKLISYLAKHKHFSPFNHAFISSRIKAPIFVARQLVKHKFMPWNEVSRRYVDSEPEFFIPTLRERAENVKQGSSDLLMPSMWKESGIEHMKNMFEYYNSAIAAGMAPEVARAFLPQNMMTDWIWSGTLGAYADMLRLRLDPHTQYESRIVAQKLHEQISSLFPISLKALLND